MNKIVFVDDSDSFIIKRIEKNLQEIGFECSTLTWSVDIFEEFKEDFSDVVVAYIENMVPSALVYLRDICIERNLRLYVIGYEDDLNEIKKEYALTNIEGEFHRPLNANEVAEKIVKSVKDNVSITKKHILVVDDSGTMLTTIQEWLGDRYRVSIVNSAMNAITFLGKNTPDLILLDYEMPSCSGPQLLEMLRAEVRTEKIPVIFLTGKDDPESVKSVLNLKPAGYLLKTMPKDYIIGQVDEFFEKEKRGSR